MANTNSTKTNNFTNLTQKQIRAYNIKNRTNISNILQALLQFTIVL